MAHQPRPDLPGIPQHIVQHGNNRGTTFVCADDHDYYRDVLLDASRQQGVAIHAYVLMNNHVHLLAAADCRGSVGRMMQSIAGRYVRYFNRRYGRSGTLWEGRYQATSIEVEARLLACYRYIELNPVRAGLVAQPLEYRWSSHRGNVGYVDDEILSAHALFTALGRTATGRRLAYLRMFDETIGSAALQALGDDGFPPSGARADDESERRLMARGGHRQASSVGPAAASERDWPPGQDRSTPL